MSGCCRGFATMMIRADARQLPLVDGCVQMVCTSPPYWGLRDYGIAGQIGLEPTLEEYVATMVEVFREVRRVLKDDATVWLNLGDSYSSIGHKKSNSGYGTTGLAGGVAQEHSPLHWEKNGSSSGLKHKDLCMIPARVALALQADGWWLRSDIVWAKSNPMPESVTDRPTRSHEYISLLAKSERYFYDAAAIMEPASAATHARIAQPRVLSQLGGDKDYGPDSNRSARRTLTNYASRALGVSPKAAAGTVGVERQNASFTAATADLVLERNKRDVWTINSEATPEAQEGLPK